MRDVCCGFVSEVLAWIERKADEKGIQRSLRLQWKIIESHHVVPTCKKHRPAVARLSKQRPPSDSIDEIRVIEGYRGMLNSYVGALVRGDV